MDSAKCRVLPRRPAMSAFGGKADIEVKGLYFRLWPKANIEFSRYRTSESAPITAHFWWVLVQRSHGPSGTTGLKSGAVLSLGEEHDTRRWNRRSRGQEAVPQGGNAAADT